jgi:hypothetical protein
MKTKITLCSIWTLLFVGSLFGQDLIHYWNFNDESSVANMLLVNQTIGGAQINHLQEAGISAIVVGTGQNFSVDNLNARNGAPAGSHLRFNDPIGGGLEFLLPTTGHEAVVISFATRRSGQGAGNQHWYYSTNAGQDYTLFTTVESQDANPVLVTLDFSALPAVNDNADFRIKVEFTQGAGGTAGNNRFDNFAVDAYLLGTGNNPVLTVSPESLNSFTQTLGFPSSPQTLSVTAQNLTSSVAVSVTGNHQVSLNESDDFSSLVSIPSVLGSVSSVPVYVRLNASNEGPQNAVLTLSATGVDDIVINLSGQANVSQTALLYYWHFNTLVTPNDVTEIDADFSLLAGFTASFEYTDAVQGQRDIDAFSPGTLLNIQMGQTTGSAARVRNPAAQRSLLFDVPTTGAQNIVFSYAVQRSNNGALTNTIEYSLDGVNFTSTNLVNSSQNVDGAEIWQVLTYDFSTIDEADDNPNFKIRITWGDANAANLSGNNRFDNITITGNLLQDDLGLINNEQVVAVYPNPAIEEINLVSNTLIEEFFVFNTVGALVGHQDQLNMNAANFDVSILEPGVYIVLIHTKSGFSQVRFIKN